MKEEICELLAIADSTIYKFRKEKRPIITFLEKYFTKEDLEEFLTYGKVSRLEYCNSVLENEKWFFVTFNEILSALYNLHKSDFEMVLEKNEEYAKYRARYPHINTIDYLCFVLAENKFSGSNSNLFDILIRYYDKYKSQINSQMESSCLEEIYDIFSKNYNPHTDFINLISINNSLYVVKKIIYFYNELDESDLVTSHKVNLAMEFSIRYNLYLKKSNKNFEEIYDKYKVPEFGKSKIDYDKFKKDIDNL